MAKSETLSVRLDPQTRRVLAEAAATHDAAGASALALDILERWAKDARDARSPGNETSSVWSPKA